MTLIVDQWSIVAASLAGRAHQRARRGSDDVVCVRRGVCGGGSFVVAVVCDGCSAGGASGVGAGLGARFVAADVARRVAAGASLDDEFAGAVVDALVVELGRVAAACAVDDERDVVADCLLFTVQVAVVVDDGAGSGGFLVFGVGDGVVGVDGAFFDVGGCVDGAPDCPAYRLLDDLRQHATVRVHARGATSTLGWLVVGSDGAAEVADLSAFADDDALVRNPSLATKRLAARGAAAPDDDCSFVVVRRAPARIAEVTSCAS